MDNVLYFFRVRDSISGKCRQTRYRLTENEARQRYGEGNYERLDWSREVRTGSGSVHSAPLAPDKPNVIG
jgi:hypothetical protein